MRISPVTEGLHHSLETPGIRLELLRVVLMSANEARVQPVHAGGLKGQLQVIEQLACRRFGIGYQRLVCHDEPHEFKLSAVVLGECVYG